jgi:O-antigen/teichoic acid export membrane protein
MTSPVRRLLGGQLVRSTAIYAGADAINKGIPFLLLPVIAMYLSPADYGRLANFSVLTQILVAFCALNTYSALSVSFFNLGGIPLRSYLSNLLYLVAMLVGVCLLISSALASTIEHYLGLTRPWQLLALLTACATAVYTLYLSLLRMQSKIIRFSALQIGQSLISSILAVLFVVHFHWNWQGRVASIVVAAAASMLFSLWSVWRHEQLFARPDRDQLKSAFSFGLPLLPHTLSFWLKTGMVKIIISNSLGLSANGIYSIALTLGSIVGVFTDSFFSAYSPIMYKDLSLVDAAPEREGASILRRLVRNTYRFAGAQIVVCVGGWLVMRVAIPMLFKPSYLEAVRLMPLIFLGLCLDGGYTILSGYVFYRRKTTVLGSITFLSSVLQMGLALLLVPRFGLAGALYAGCTVSLLTFLAVLTYANTLYVLPWRLATVG